MDSDEKKQQNNDNEIHLQASVLLFDDHSVGFTPNLLNEIWNDIQYQLTFLLQQKQTEWQNEYSLYYQNNRLIKQAIDLGNVIHKTKYHNKIKMKIQVKQLLSLLCTYYF